MDDAWGIGVNLLSATHMDIYVCLTRNCAGAYPTKRTACLVMTSTLLHSAQTLWPLVWTDQPHTSSVCLGEEGLKGWFRVVLKTKTEAWAWINEHAKHIPVSVGGSVGENVEGSASCVSLSTSG